MQLPEKDGENIAHFCSITANILFNNQIIRFTFLIAIGRGFKALQLSPLVITFSIYNI